MALDHLNKLKTEQLKTELFRCCGSTAWVESMIKIFPVNSEAVIFSKAEEIWFSLDKNDWLEAFRHHPKIGDLELLKKKFASTAAWAAGEQASVASASAETLQALAEANRLYEEKFGYIFIICATGKTADEMLAALQQRLGHSPQEEWLIAAAEQNKITKLRLEKLLS
jgi:2-oxo-4-hydroxy-4-carboxy-5-ureidoimidazoline decarboxylase